MTNRHAIMMNIATQAHGNTLKNHCHCCCSQSENLLHKKKAILFCGQMSPHFSLFSGKIDIGFCQRPDCSQ